MATPTIRSPIATKYPTPTPTSPVKDKAPRTILKRKGTPGNNNNTSSSSLLGSARFAQQEIIKEGKPDMAASFLQFCAMCEKQIMTPCNSILYCSEACRRKDSVKPLTASIITTTSITPPPSEAPSSPRPILSPRVPTGVSEPSRTPPTISIPAELHDHSSDLDPTEWKPKLPHRNSSEAFRYLSRFHHSMMAMSGTGGNIDDVVAASVIPTPSLGNTPTTTSSSFSESRYSSFHNSYDYNTRPLPTRPNRWYSFSGGTPKGIDLVTPHVVPPAPALAQTPTISEDSVVKSTIANDEGLNWEKRKVMFAIPGRGDDGLSILFAEHK